VLIWVRPVLLLSWTPSTNHCCCYVFWSLVHLILSLSISCPYLTRSVWHCGLRHLHWKVSLRQKKKYGNSIISPCKYVIFKKNPLKETKIFQDIVTLQQISSFKTSKNPCIKIDRLTRGQNPLSYYTLQWISTQYPCLPRQGQ